MSPFSGAFRILATFLLLGLAIISSPLAAQETLTPSPSDRRGKSNSADLRAADTAFGRGDYQAAVNAYRRAIDSGVNSAQVHLNLGRALQQLGRPAAAGASFRDALRVDPKSVDAHVALGTALALEGNSEGASKHLYEAQRLSGGNSFPITKTLALNLLSFGKTDEALSEAEAAVKRWPKEPEAHSMLAQILATRGKPQEALKHYREGLRLAPDSAEMLNNLAWLLATHPDAAVRDAKEAVRFAERAAELTQRKMPMVLGTLAAAYAEAGRFDDAIKAGEEAAALTESGGNKQLAEINRKLVAQYRAGKPYREERK